MSNSNILTLLSSLLLSGASLTATACHSKAAEAAALTAETTPVSAAPTRISVTDISPREAARWADSVMATLTPGERIRQLFVCRLDIPDNETGYAKLKSVIGDHKVGGMLMGKQTLRQYANIINKAQEYARVPALITLDGEWGLNMRVEDAPAFPVNIALGAGADTALVSQYGREVARQCRAIGIHVDFAPVLDVNSNPDNPVIGYRSFGEDPELVARLGQAYCRGMEEGGVMSVGKHFPDHGDTNTDSHKALPTINHSIQTLRDVDFRPFERCIATGMSGIMIGHLKVPSLDSTGTPASMSKIITTDWLCDTLGFNGLIFTDALGMKGAVMKENNCVGALLAGADVLLNPSNLPVDIKAVEDAVKAGKISQQEIDRRCRKLLMYKYKLGCGRHRADAEHIREIMFTPECDRLILELSRKAITLLPDTANTLPLDSAKNIVVLNVGGQSDSQFVKSVKELSNAKVYNIASAAALTQSIRRQLKEADAVVVAISSSAKNAAGVLDAVKPDVAVLLMNPFKAKNLGKSLHSARSILLAYDDLTQSGQAAAEALFGLIPTPGRLPVSIPNLGTYSKVR